MRTLAELSIVQLFSQRYETREFRSIHLVVTFVSGMELKLCTCMHTCSYTQHAELSESILISPRRAEYVVVHMMLEDKRALVT